jgi:hypothetical protein
VCAPPRPNPHTQTPHFLRQQGRRGYQQIRSVSIPPTAVIGCGSKYGTQWFLTVTLSQTLHLSQPRAPSGALQLSAALVGHIPIPAGRNKRLLPRAEGRRERGGNARHDSLQICQPSFPRPADPSSSSWSGGLPPTQNSAPRIYLHRLAFLHPGKSNAEQMLRCRVGSNMRTCVKITQRAQHGTYQEIFFMAGDPLSAPALCVDETHLILQCLAMICLELPPQLRPLTGGSKKIRVPLSCGGHFGRKAPETFLSVTMTAFHCFCSSAISKTNVNGEYF